MKDIHLSKAQKKAVETVEGQLLIISCPGSGKTSTVIRRVKHMVEIGIPGPQILVLTFSKAAAAEMEVRYRLLGTKDTSKDKRPVFSTIHSFCFTVVRQTFGYTLEDILSDTDAWMIIRKGIDELGLKETGTEIRDMDEFVNSCIREISVLNNNMLTHINWDTYSAQTCPTEDFRKIYDLYEARKKDAGKIDFDDMLKLCLQAFETDPQVLYRWRECFRYLIVDEYQDTNYLQRDILYLLAGDSEHANICVVGDDDQSIYRFRGARPEIMLSFPDAYPDCTIIHMETNYRSEPEIIDAAKELIEHNNTRFPKDIRPAKKGKGTIETWSALNPTEEACEVVSRIEKLRGRYALEEIAILYRNNRQGGLFARELMEKKIPFHTNEPVESPYRHWIFQDLTAYWRLSQGEGSLSDLLQVINRPCRYILFNDVRKAWSKKGLDKTHKRLVSRIRSSAEPDWRKEKLEKNVNEFFSMLDGIQGESPEAFISKMLDLNRYGKYLQEYADCRDIPVTDLTEVTDSYLDDIRRKEITTFEEWMTYANRVNAMIDSHNREKSRQGVTLSTMHRSKGLEWSLVFVTGASEKIIPGKDAEDPVLLEEERRLFYVSVTRAKEHLEISWVQGGSGTSTLVSVSLFVDEMGLLL